MQDEWDLGHAGLIGYLEAIAKLADFRKVNGASVVVLSGLSSTETYLKKARKTVSKMMRLQWINELDIDTLEFQGTLILGHARRAFGSCYMLLASLRERT